jgi:hypothetical protein
VFTSYFFNFLKNFDITDGINLCRDEPVKNYNIYENEKSFDIDDFITLNQKIHSTLLDSNESILSTQNNEKIINILVIYPIVIIIIIN